MTPDIVVGDNAADIARHKARYGHRSWIAWIGRDGQKRAARLTPYSLKQAMLAIGTQGTFARYYSERESAIGSWQIAAMWLRAAKSGIEWNFK